MKQFKWCVIAILAVIFCGVMVSGCIAAFPKNLTEKPEWPIPDPETGIAAWIVAVNDRNYDALYDLMPSSQRAGITREQYIKLNREYPPPFLESGNTVTGFIVLNRSVNGLNATIIAGLQTIRVSSRMNQSPVQETVFFTFDEKFEDYEWKVWTRK